MKKAQNLWHTPEEHPSFFLTVELIATRASKVYPWPVMHLFIGGRAAKMPERKISKNFWVSDYNLMALPAGPPIKTTPTRNKGLFMGLLATCLSLNRAFLITGGGFHLSYLQKPTCQTFLESTFKVADLSPTHVRKQSATDGTKPDLNIGETQGLAA